MKKTLKTLMTALVMVAVGTIAANAQILYKVEKPGSDKVSYLLGTHHFAPLAIIDSIAEMPSILQGIDKLYGELDMSVMKDQTTMLGMQQKMIAPADSTLDKVLTAAQLDSLGQLLNSYAGGAVPLQMMYPLKPAVISTQLAALMTQKVFPELNGLQGIDMTMQDRARELGKPVAGLETMDFQIDMLYNRPISDQVESLLGTMRDPQREEEQAVNVSKAYQAHDIAKILDLMLEMEDEDAATAERLIYSRNDNWVRQLAAEMPTESIMVVVGAGHLPGPRGVIEGLKKAGFTVTPVK